MPIGSSLESDQIISGWEHVSWKSIPDLSVSSKKRGKESLSPSFFLISSLFV